MNLVVGASGFIGNSIFNSLKQKGLPVLGTYNTRSKSELIHLDMTDFKEIESIFQKYNIQTIYIPAYIPGVDYCELNEEPNRINLLGVKNLVDICEEFKSKLIFFSTDYLFDGKSGPYQEVDTPSPINMYGKTKLESEMYIKKLEDYLIIRTTVVYGYYNSSKNFFMTLMKYLLDKKEIRVPSDQIGSPTYIKDLVNISINLVEDQKKGIYNVVGPDLCSRYAFSLKIARYFELNEKLIIPVKTSELNQPAKRPLKAGLIIDKIRIEINACPLGIDQTLAELKQFVLKNQFNFS